MIIKKYMQCKKDIVANETRTKRLNKCKKQNSNENIIIFAAVANKSEYIQLKMK